MFLILFVVAVILSGPVLFVTGGVLLASSIRDSRTKNVDRYEAAVRAFAPIAETWNSSTVSVSGFYIDSQAATTNSTWVGSASDPVADNHADFTKSYAATRFVMPLLTINPSGVFPVSVDTAFTIRGKVNGVTFSVPVTLEKREYFFKVTRDYACNAYGAYTSYLTLRDCAYRYLATDICLVASKDGTVSGKGCYYNSVYKKVMPETYISAYYPYYVGLTDPISIPNVANPLSPIRPVTITIRREEDPAVLLSEITKGTGYMGDTQTEKRRLGIACLFFGSAILLATGFACGCFTKTNII